MATPFHWSACGRRAHALGPFLIVHWPLILTACWPRGRRAAAGAVFATLFLPMLAATELLNAFDGTYRAT